MNKKKKKENHQKNISFFVAYNQVTFKWALVGCTKKQKQSLTPSDNGAFIKIMHSCVNIPFVEISIITVG